MKHWEQSSVPYFAVVTDSSSVNGTQRTSYPEVRYVFADDPLYYELESQGVDETEEALVVDLDASGERVIGYKSLGEDIGVLDVRMKDKDSTKTVEIDITRSELEGLDQLRPVKDIAELRKLVELFQERSEQLYRVVH